MTIQIGDTLPAAVLNYLKDGVQSINTTDLFANKTVVLFAVPGAFTPTCSAKHLPGFVDKLADLKAKGVDTVACMAVNELLQALTAFRGEGGMKPERRRRFDAVEERTTTCSPRQECEQCATPRIWGRADVTPFLHRIG